MALDGRKVYINEDWLEALKENINDNIKFNKIIMENNPEVNRTKEIDDAEYLLKKLDMYKKIDGENRIHYYLFPNELELIMWILLENTQFYKK